MIENLEQLLQYDIISVAEDDGYFYVRTKPDGAFDNTIWRVNKRTGKVSYMLLTVFFSIEKGTKSSNRNRLMRYFRNERL